MALNIVISPSVRFKVAGSITTEDGKDAPFDFWLTAERLKDTAEVQGYLDSIKDADPSARTPVTDALALRITGWDGVKSGSQAVDFSDASLRALLNMPGMALLVHSRYLRECGAKEKN